MLRGFLLVLAACLGACGPHLVFNNPVPGGPFQLLPLVLDNAPLCQDGGYTLMFLLDTNDNGEAELGEDRLLQTLQLCHGQPAAAPVPVIEVFVPCPEIPGLYREVILILSDGTMLASFSDNADGKNTRLSVLPPGTYKTTDGRNCIFTVGG
jgi:hypothetical protein